MFIYSDIRIKKKKKLFYEYWIKNIKYVRYTFTKLILILSVNLLIFFVFFEQKIMSCPNNKIIGPLYLHTILMYNQICNVRNVLK